jgi:hypothetical protein
MEPVLPHLAPAEELSPEGCAAVAKRAASSLDANAFVRDDAHQRIFELLWRDANSEAWLVSWAEPRDTGYHDHDGSNGGIYVLEGEVSEEPLVVRGPARVGAYGPGETFSFAGRHIHRMHHEPGAVTIHVYSPSLRSIGAYDIVDGVLVRTPESPDEESPESRALDEALAT